MQIEIRREVNAGAPNRTILINLAAVAFDILSFQPSINILGKFAHMYEEKEKRISISQIQIFLPLRSKSLFCPLLFAHYSNGHFNPYVLVETCIVYTSTPALVHYTFYIQDQSIAHPYLLRSSISSLYLFTKYIRLKSISHTKTGRAKAKSPSPHQYSSNFLSKKDGRCKSCGGRLVGWTIGKVRARNRRGSGIKLGRSVLPNTL